MKKRMVTMLIILSLLALPGCKVDVEELSLATPLTQQELVDYYKDDIKYTASYESRSLVDRETIEKYEIKDKGIRERVTKAQGIIEEELKAGEHNEVMTVSKSQMEFIKSMLDDKYITRNKVESIKGGSDYYFVDVSYKINAQPTGAINDVAKYLGIHGVFTEDENGNNYMDSWFVQTVNQKIAENAATIQKEEYRASRLNEAVGIPLQPVATEPQEQKVKGEQKVKEEKRDEDKQAGADTQQPANKEIVNSKESNGTAGTETMRTVEKEQGTNYLVPVRGNPLDVCAGNRLAGSSTTQTAIMPKLLMVYSPAVMGGYIGGYGIFPQGAFDASVFGYNRNNMGGTAVLRYVFKEGLKDNTKIYFKAVYPVSICVDNKLDGVEKSIVSDTILNEINKAVDRADRAIMNNDITALMSGRIFGDVGSALVYCNKYRNNYVIANYSKVTDVISRKDNRYLVKLDQYYEESIKDSGLVLKYNNKYYAVIQQNNDKMVINDYICAESKLVDDPDLITESTYIKSLIALSSGGSVSDKNKKEIQSLLSSLYSSSTSRKLQGMYNCFNTDKELLSEEHREYLNSRLRGWLVAEGVSTKAVYNGKIKKWISGSPKQAELVCEEAITYGKGRKGKKIEMYYLVSCYENKWLIDEMRVLSIEDIGKGK